MSSKFIDQFVADENLSQAEAAVFHQVGVRSTEDVDSLVRTFPSIMDVGVRLGVVSNAAALHLGSSYTSVAAAVIANPPPAATGANPPPGVPFTIGTMVGSAPPSAALPSTPSPSMIDLRKLPWPVRSQGARGTCVAFGTAACVEHLQSATEGANPNYSEQFLYWAIKDHSADPNKHKDGTWLGFAKDVLHSDGICHERLWPYTSTIIHPVSGPAPNASAVGDAASHKRRAGTYLRRPVGGAVKLLQLLQSGRPVAVSLPVFSDPAIPESPNKPTNWTTPIGWAYGRVIDPPPRSVVKSGHCVCVTGFVPDPAEPNGGYFIIRNSWDIQWGSLAPNPASHSPERGYGEISATYVESYCWEMLQL